MTSRREFLQIGVTAALPLAVWPRVAQGVTAPAMTAPGQATGIDPLQYAPLMDVVYDTRFAESVAFARRSAALGLTTHAIAGDMTHLWYDVVYHRWKQGPKPLAGLTAHGPLFCFGELARDVGLRVVYREEHPGRSGRDTTLYTWVIAPPRTAGT